MLLPVGSSMVKKIFCLWAFAGWLSIPMMAQTPDSVRVIPSRDTLLTAMADSAASPGKKKKGWAHRVFSKNYPHPRTAAFLSMALPGAGQAYNKKWWKIPVVWGALGGVGYFTFKTQGTYRELRDSYKLLVDGDPNTNPTEAPYNTLDATLTKSYRDQFRGYTEKWYIALGVTYLLTVTDAFVDAHLTRFDVDDNLSLRLRPALDAAPGMPAFGLGVSLSFHPSLPRRERHY
ncbi:MAG: DUF5683 domain-containing protein [Saprospiraceae bacterium]|nr:DUF5683 domain-containing protein [Saprospiraceae bacterium]